MNDSLPSLGRQEQALTVDVGLHVQPPLTLSVRSLRLLDLESIKSVSYFEDLSTSLDLFIK